MLSLSLFLSENMQRKKKRKPIKRFECESICAITAASLLAICAHICSVCILLCICMCAFSHSSAHSLLLHQSLCLFVRFPFFVCTPINLIRFHIAHNMYLAVFNLFVAAAELGLFLSHFDGILHDVEHSCCEHADARFQLPSDWGRSNRTGTEGSVTEQRVHARSLFLHCAIL